MLTLMPVDFAKTVWIMLHQSACTEQITLTWPWAAAPLAHAHAAANTAHRCIVIECPPAAARRRGEASYPVPHGIRPRVLRRHRRPDLAQADAGAVPGVPPRQTA